MAVLGSYRQIYKQDYSQPNQADIDTLSLTLNPSFQAIYSCLTNQVTLADNINCTIVNFTTQVGQTFAPQAPVVLKLASYQKSINGIVVINAVPTGNKSALPTAGIFLSYTQNNSPPNTNTSGLTNNPSPSANALTVNVNYITGLPLNTQFTITAIIF